MKTIRIALLLITLMGISFHSKSQVIMVTEMKDSSAITEFVTAGDKLFFASYSHSDSMEIWATNGTLNSSMMIKKLPGFYLKMGPAPLFFFDYNGSLIFQSIEDYSYDEGWHLTYYPYLWKSDGTTEGTVKLKKLETWFYQDDDYPNTWGGNYIQLDDKLLFAASSPDTLNFELWSTDGTSNGTKELLEINKNNLHEPWYAPNRSSFPSSLCKMGNKMYFSANDAVHGQELWVTDGTVEGTHLLKDINPGDLSGLDFYYHEEEFIACNEKLFFTAQYAKELWVSDGSVPGTKIINNFQDSYTSPDKGIFFRNLTHVDGQLYFEVGFWNYTALGDDSTQIWKSDGTEKGTMKVFDITEMNTSSFIYYKSKLYFFNKGDGGIKELWKSDGTETGTVRISQFWESENTTNELYVFNDSIYFAALDDKSLICKIWKSDGTSEGTRPLENWNEGAIRSISKIVHFKDGIYFAGQYGIYGEEVFKYYIGPDFNNGKGLVPSYDKLIISPNPVADYLNINLPDSEQKGIITVYDIRGAEMLSISVNPGKQIINTDISKFKNGLYIVSFTSNSGTRKAKFIKE
jgi:ELWxxDGT repeat protein